MHKESGSAMIESTDLPDELFSDSLPSPPSDTSETTERSDCSIKPPTTEEQLLSDLFQDLEPSLHLEEEYEQLSSLNPSLLQVEDGIDIDAMHGKNGLDDQGIQVVQGHNFNTKSIMMPDTGVLVSDVSDSECMNNVGDLNYMEVGRVEGEGNVYEASTNGMVTSFQRSRDEFGPNHAIGKSGMSEVRQCHEGSTSTDNQAVGSVALPMAKKSRRASAIRATQVIREVSLNEHKLQGNERSSDKVCVHHASRAKRMAPQSVSKEIRIDSLVNGQGQQKKARMSNAESAKLNRERHKNYVDGLEQTIEEQNQEIKELQKKLAEKDDTILSKDRKILHLQNVLHNDTALAHIIGKVVPKAKPVISNSAVNDHCYDAACSQVPNVAFLGNICLTVKDEHNVSINSCADCAQATVKQEDV